MMPYYFVYGRTEISFKEKFKIYFEFYIYFNLLLFQYNICFNETIALIYDKYYTM